MPTPRRFEGLIHHIKHNLQKLDTEDRMCNLLLNLPTTITNEVFPAYLDWAYNVQRFLLPRGPANIQIRRCFSNFGDKMVDVEILA